MLVCLKNMVCLRVILVSVVSMVFYELYEASFVCSGIDTKSINDIPIYVQIYLFIYPHYNFLIWKYMNF